MYKHIFIIPVDIMGKKYDPSHGYGIVDSESHYLYATKTGEGTFSDGLSEIENGDGKSWAVIYKSSNKIKNLVCLATYKNGWYNSEVFIPMVPSLSGEEVFKNRNIWNEV